MRLLFLTAVFVGTAVAAPIPKSMLKRSPSSADGVWQLKEIWYDGEQCELIDSLVLWEIDGEDFYMGRKFVDGVRSIPIPLTTPDATKPKLKKFGAHSAIMEIDGGTMKFCYALDTASTIAECVPAASVKYFLLERSEHK